MSTIDQFTYEELETNHDSFNESLIIHKHKGKSKSDTLIILIHGLGGKRYGNKSTWGNFPKYLFDDFLNIDVGLYEYQTLFRRIPFFKSMDFNEEATVLADILRENTDYSKIIIIAHSLGGILSLGAIRHFFTSGQTECLSKICGLFLMASPQAGALWIPRWLSIFSKDFHILRAHSQYITKIGKMLTNSFNIEEVNTGRKYHIPIWAVRGGNDNWVDKFSATSGVPDKQCLTSTGTHKTVVKPTSKESQEYEFVVNRIKKLQNSFLDKNAHKNKKKLFRTYYYPLMAPNIFDRDIQLAELRNWIVPEECNLISIEGMRGIGKTQLVAHLLDRYYSISQTHNSDKDNSFEKIEWFGLNNPKNCLDFIDELLERLIGTVDLPINQDLESKLNNLVEILNSKKCLCVFDNVESLLQSEGLPGTMLSRFRDYDELFKVLGLTKHKSIILLTTRENPSVIKSNSTRSGLIRVYNLNGIGGQGAKAIFNQIDKFSCNNESDWTIFTDAIGGNPLAIDIIARHIKEVFFSNLSEFIRKGTLALSRIEDILEWHFHRLSEDELKIAYQLALSRTPISLSELQSSKMLFKRARSIPEAIESLSARLPLIRGNNLFSLQPVLMEFFSLKVILNCCSEILSKRSIILDSYILLNTKFDESIRDAQRYMILEPIWNKLKQTLKTDNRIVKRLNDLVNEIRVSEGWGDVYTSGNIANLIDSNRKSIENFDFSDMRIISGNFQGIRINNSNFENCIFDGCLFTNTFGNILEVAFAHNKNLIAASDSNKNIQIWDLSDKKLIHTLPGHNSWVLSIAFNNEGTRVASGGEDRFIRIWNVQNGFCEKAFIAHSSRVRSVKFSPDDKLLISGGDDKLVKIWNCDDWSLRKTNSLHKERVWSVSVSNDGSMFASGGNDGTIRIQTLPDGQIKQEIKTHSKWVMSVCFSPDPKNVNILSSGTGDGAVQLWDVETGESVLSFKDHKTWVRSVAFSPDGNFIASASADNTIRIWDLITKTCAKVLEGHHNWVRTVSFSPDGEFLASGSEDQTIILWRVSDWTKHFSLIGYTNWIRYVDFCPNGRFCLISSTDKIVRIWDSETQKYTNTELIGHNSWVRCAKYSPDMGIIATASEDHMVKIWDSKNGLCQRTLSGHSNWVWLLTFSPDGELLATGSDDQNIILWNTKNWTRQGVLTGHSNRVRALDFSKNESVLASGGEDDLIIIWDSNNGKEKCRFVGGHERIFAIAFHSNLNILVSGGEDGKIRVWDTLTWESIRTLTNHTDRIWTLSFSKDGKILASGSEDNSICIWDTSDWSCKEALNGHKNRVRSLSFGKKDKILASGSEDETIKIWDIEKSIEVYSFKIDPPYHMMNISKTEGLGNAQKEALLSLGAIEA